MNRSGIPSKRPKLTRPLILGLLSAGLLWINAAHGSTSETPAPTDPILSAMKQELTRSFAQLKNAGKAPLYYLAYRLTDCNYEQIRSDNGALSWDYDHQVQRSLSIDLRVGKPLFDNTHFLRKDNSDPPAICELSSDTWSMLAEHGGGAPLRQVLWFKTDEAFKSAQERYASLKANSEVLAAEDDESGDFSLIRGQIYESPVKKIAIDSVLWQQRMRRLSRLFLKHPFIGESSVYFEADPRTRYIVTSEGSQLREQHLSYGVYMSANTRTEDGMEITLYDDVERADPATLYDEKALVKKVENLAHSLEQLRKAPVAEPYVGPAILSGRAAAVFFHETFGHRIEGHRQKKEVEGKTFARKIGVKIMPSFISVVDDPTVRQVRGLPLTGYYNFDDEGVKAQRAVLVKNGILTGFLMGRAPTREFSSSNGHGRAQPNQNTVPRQGNLIISSTPSSQVSPHELRVRLIREAKRQHKQYGLYFEDIRGGETYTSTDSDQTYSVFPVRVYKVFVNGRPDQLIRGVDIVGTPLASLEKIIASGNDYDVFNGTCGAESGDIPVSASAPSLLLQSIEVKRSSKSFEKMPILPAPSLRAPTLPATSSPVTSPTAPSISAPSNLSK